MADAISRKFYQLKSHVGASSKTLDTEVQLAKSRLSEMQKKFKNVSTVIKKLSPTVHATNLMQVEVLTSLRDVLESTNPMAPHIDGVIDTFQRLDQGVSEYESRIENDILIPLKTFTEQFKILEKRFDIVHTRRVDMDRFHQKVLDISKKPPGKQVGLAEAQSQYNRSRDLYNYLRNEVLADVDIIAKSFDEVVAPICSILISNYTTYLNHINDNWETATDICPNFVYDTINSNHTITPAEVSMVIDANVTQAKSKDVENGMYKNKSSSSSDDDDGSQMKKMTTSTAAASMTRSTGGKRPPPAPPGKRKEQVRCDYDYTAQEDNELSFREGDIITVLKKEGDWWYGELRGKEGLFPYNYVSAL